ncbi:Glucanosyltransferase-domain-containing protein, partial [Dimargaris cristalligena]
STALLAVTPVVQAATKVTNRLTIQGTRFYETKSKQQYYIKGVIYQPNNTNELTIPDPLADASGCERDIPYLQDLGVNTIRVPITDNDQDHDDCMNQLADANINVFLDLLSVNASMPAYDTFMLDDFVKKIDTFRKYPNFVGVFAGNEVVTSNVTTVSAGYVKAIVRDVKAYIAAREIQLYVGYSSGDDPVTRNNIMQYMNCGNVKDQVDFYALNLHSWCGDDVNFQNSGFEDATKNTTKLTVPVIMGEFGCKGERPQSFGEVGPLFGSELVDTFSGGFASSYGDNSTDYGLVAITSKGVKTLDEFDNLKDQYSQASPKSVSMDKADPIARKSQSCPRITPDWLSALTLPPMPSPKACQCLVNSFTCALNFGSEDTDMDALNRTNQRMCPAGKCSEIFADPANGVYGTWTMCPYEVKMAFMINQNYTK